MAEEARGRQGAAKHVRASKSRYVPALDGLRSFAVLAVIFYHMDMGWARGGLMGVTIFFVISGYLINGLLVAERERTGTISLVGFWMRRIRRLFPAIFLCVVGTAALCTIFNHTLLDKMRPDIVPSLLFYNNWWQIFRDISYFEQAGSPSPLTHFWSLSIEEQFYVVWPLLLLAMYGLGAKKKVMRTVVMVLAAISAIAMAIMYQPTGDPSRVYYGTDTRAMSLLIGVWLAFIWPSAAFGEEPKMANRDTGVWIGFNIAGVVALVALVLIVGFTNGYSAFPYYGGILLVSVLSALLIAVLAVPETWVGRLFELPPFVWIGKLSYGMYLWHFPILLLMTNPNSTTGVEWWVRVIQLGLIVGVSFLSFKFVEDPIRKGKLGEWLRAQTGRTSSRGRHASDANGGAQADSRASQVRSAALENIRFVAPAGCFALLLAVALVGVFLVPPTDYASVYAGKGNSGQEQGQEARSEESDFAEPPGSVSGGETFEKTFGTERKNAAGEQIYEPLLIGDSVSAGAVDAFYEAFPNGYIDAVVNRNIWESPYSDYADADQVGDYVVFCLGTNNAVEDWQIDEDLLAAVPKDKHVFMVNTRNGRDWQDGTNEAIARTPERHPNVTVIDWLGASEGHDEWFAGDGTHLNAEGAQAYIGLIKDAIAKSMAGSGTSRS